MAEVATNRDLYRFIAELVKQRSECRGTLQSYLENLRRIGRSLRARDAVSPEEFAELLGAAFDPGPRAADPGAAATDGYVGWEERIGEQIRDLDEMRRSGTLDNEYRYFGVDAPRGGRWYNFDPCTYLECAAAGSMDPRDIHDPVVALPQITWEMFVDFLNAGQWYE